MKALKLKYIALAALTLSLTACQQEDDFVPQEQEINLNITAGGLQTRVNTLEGGNMWENGDELYFCRVSKDNQRAIHTLTATVADEVTTWTPDNKLFWDDSGEHKLVVYYPRTGLAWDNWCILADQSTLPNLEKADYMNAMWIGAPTTNPINLNLKHRLSMVTVTYTLASELEPTVEITPEVYCYTQYIFFDINTLERVRVDWEEGDDIWVKGYKYEDLDADDNVVKKFTAIVSPDAYAARDEFIRVTIGDQVLTANMKEDITFKEGTHYTFNLKVGKDKVTVEQVSTNNDSPFGEGWNNEEDLM